MRGYAIAIAMLLGSTAPAFAEPPKDEPAKANQPQQRPAEIVLASAEQVNASVQASSSNTAKRRVAPRATTCRCGDQHSAPENPEQ